MGEENDNLVYPSSWDFIRSLTCHNILRHDTSGFTSHSKEGVLRIFISLKNPSPWPGSNPQPLSPVASTLTTTRPRRQNGHWRRKSHKTLFHYGAVHVSTPRNIDMD
jgi:hypothetical protein